MQITFYSILTAVFWSGILAGMLFVMRRMCRNIRYFGVSCVVCICLFCMLRILLPIDFSFTKGILLQGVFADVCDVLCFQKFAVGSFQITLWKAFLIVWFLVAGVLVSWFVREYRSTYRLVDMLTERKDGQCRTALQRVYEEKGKKYEVTVLKGDGIKIPIGIGLFRKRILLPDREYTDDMLYFVLLHEYTHFVNGDLMLKTLVHVICRIFWWNPFMYYLQNNLEKILEIKCDMCITETLSLKDTLLYMQTIMTTLETSGKKKFPAINDSVSLVGERNEMLERFSYIQRSQMKNGENRKGIAAWILVFAIVWAASYCFLPLPAYQPSAEEIETNQDAYTVMPEDFYILYKNGKYYLISEEGVKIEIEDEVALEMETCGYKIKEE